MNTASSEPHRARRLLAVLGVGGLAVALLVAPATAPKLAAADGVQLQTVGNFDSPVYVTAPPQDRRRLFVVEKPGRIRVVVDGRVLAEPFLDLTGRVGSASEQGLLSMAFAPNYHKSRRFYVNYVNKAGNTRVVEYRRKRNTENRAIRRSARTVLKVRQPATNHNGGQLAFGPDGLLYIGMGDGGGGGDTFGNGQNLRTLNGAMLRIDPRRKGRRAYRIPRSNPFVGRKAAKNQIYAYGLRNPWRFSFDRRNGALVIADVGQSDWEEVNYRKQGRARGANFGWPVWEGRARYGSGTARGHDRPALVRGHDDGWCSITGGYVVRDRSLPSLYGRYLYGDFCDSEIRSAKLGQRRAKSDSATGLSVPRLVSFGEDASGHVYTVSLRGEVSRIVSG